VRAEIRIFRVIGSSWFEDGITHEAFVAELDALGLKSGDELLVRVNSPGGSVAAGLGIYNALKALRVERAVKVIARVEGWAASAASFIVQAATEIEAAKASTFMVHRAMGITIGNAGDHLDQAAFLEKHDGILAAIYADRTKKPEADWLAAMDAESWYTGEEAIAAGLADRLSAIDEPEQAAEAAAWSPRIVKAFRHVPAAAMRTAPGLRLAPAALAIVPPEPRHGDALVNRLAACEARIEVLAALGGLRREDSP